VATRCPPRERRPSTELTLITRDVTDSESCAAAAREVAKHTDGLGAVINYAGVLELGPLMEVSEERLRRILDVNVHAAHRAMFELVRAGCGRIVNISSESGRYRAGITAGPVRDEQNTQSRPIRMRCAKS
jgi:NAD(P)-dependent dehydrogenase (short-subunit alcohol dehydrogenase family)